MASYRLTKKAVEDLNGIWDYSFDNWSEEQADEYYESLLKSCQMIAANPGVGRNYAGIATDLFGFKSKRHIIFYRKFTTGSIEITRILNARMDLKRRIGE